ncbi:MAG TPA: three-Cys-motif partner protein TcmP [Allosphingosinicella sp.]|nr:three-Cys-motif partner protein TcmP [Allosphingosinicella sp.]
MGDSRHEFGGDWTEVKLEAISAYSKFFTGAIGGIFDLWYVDPFAGTGERTAKEQAGGLFDQQPLSTIERQYPGSAARALALKPPFDHLRFGDAKRRHAKALQALVALHPTRDASVIPGDANHFIQKMFSEPPWTAPDRGAVRSRALVFLDPYGMEVKWRTLEVLAASKKADVWFLANLKAAVQQLSHKHGMLTEEKRAALCEYFGTPHWEERFYELHKDESDLFGNPTNSSRRQATKQEVALFHKECLGTIFCYVSNPLPLAVGSIDDYFLLYCLSNNSTPAARNLIHKGADWVIRRYKQASHHRSALRGGGQ